MACVWQDLARSEARQAGGEGLVTDEREEHLQPWLHEYNWHRPHASLGYQPPISRLQSVNNLVGLHS